MLGVGEISTLTLARAHESVASSRESVRASREAIERSLALLATVDVYPFPTCLAPCCAFRSPIVPGLSEASADLVADPTQPGEMLKMESLHVL